MLRGRRCHGRRTPHGNWELDSYRKALSMVCGVLDCRAGKMLLAAAVRLATALHSMLRDASTARAGHDSTARARCTVLALRTPCCFRQRSSRSTHRKTLEHCRATRQLLKTRSLLGSKAPHRAPSYALGRRLHPPDSAWPEQLVAAQFAGLRRSRRAHIKLTCTSSHFRNMRSC